MDAYGRWRAVAAAAGIAVAAQLYGLYRTTGPPTPSWFPHADKLEHALGFAVPLFLVLVAVDLRSRVTRRELQPAVVLGVTALFAAHAVVSELIQHFFYRSRTGDPFDVLADWVGTAVGVGTYRWLRAAVERRAAVS